MRCRDHSQSNFKRRARRLPVPRRPYNLGDFSCLLGQRLSRCTCPGEEHPGPTHDDGTFVGRSAPEIDVLEATVQGGQGAVSQSGQWAPFNAGYEPFNNTENFFAPDSTVTGLNSYAGGWVFLFSKSRVQGVRLNGLCYLFSIFRQAISAISITSGSPKRVFHFCLNANDGIDFRRRWLRAQQ